MFQCGMQAKRLVKSSIIAVESVEQEVDDEDFYQDNAEITDFVNAHRGQEVFPDESTGAESKGVVSRVCTILQGPASSHL